MKKSNIILIILIGIASFSEAISQRVLVVSGGGARGAWGGGVVQNLVQDQGNDYEVVIGTSTGSLMAPLIAIDSFNTLKRIYTGVTNKSIFSVNPFKLKKDASGKVVSTKVKQLKAICRLILGKRTLGETKKLRKLIYSTYEMDRYEDILEKGDEVIITVANLTNSGVYYFSTKQDVYDSRSIDCTGKTRRDLKQCKKSKDAVRKSFLDWIWRSSNQPLFMTLNCTNDSIKDVDGNMVANENCWVDGGVRENIPLLRGIQYVMDQDSLLTNHPVIDVIINNRPEIDLDPAFKKNIVNSLFRTIGILTYDVRDNDISLPGQIQNMFDQNQITSPKSEHIEVNLYYMPPEVYDLHKWDLHFDKTGMTKLWQEGESFNVEPVKITISKEVAWLLLQKAQEVNICSGVL